MTPGKVLTRADVLRIAADACVDPRTVEGVAKRARTPSSAPIRRALAEAFEAHGYAEIAGRLRSEDGAEDGAAERDEGGR